MDALSPDDQDKDDRNYFIGASKDQFEEMMSRLETQDQDSEGEDEDPERTPFENKAAKMKDLLPDGGVKKRASPQSWPLKSRVHVELLSSFR